MGWKSAHPKTRMSGHTGVITADAVVLLLQSVWNGRLSVQEVLMLRIGGRLFVVPTAAASAPHPNLNLLMLRTKPKRIMAVMVGEVVPHFMTVVGL